MDNHILILEEGFYSSIQDLGRKGYRSFGVPISGAMDKYSAILANKLLNNKESIPVLEMTLVGPKILFEDHTLIVVTGADISPEINNMPIKLNYVYEVKTSDVLSFGTLKTGARAYLGVKGGFLTEKKLNSHSYFEGITTRKAIRKGDRLKIASYDIGLEMALSKLKVKSSHFDSGKLEVTKGPEFSRLTKVHRDLLFSSQFSVGGMNNRMGYQLTGKLPKLKESEIITSITIPGTIQLTPSGTLIIMMRDCPTTGGYPRILQLTDVSINQLAQKKENDKFRFDIESSFDFLGRLIFRFTD